VKLTTHLYVVVTLRINGAIRQHALYSFVRGTYRDKLAFFSELKYENDREERASVSKEARALRGPYSQGVSK
jgi:hypothetical protein